jgi:hypothetical protein
MKPQQKRKVYISINALNHQDQSRCSVVKSLALRKETAEWESWHLDCRTCRVEYNAKPEA